MRRRTVLRGVAAAAGISLAPGAWAEAKPGRWLRIEGPNFVVYSAADEARSRKEAAALEAFQTLLSKLMPRSQRSALKLNVYLSGSSRDFQAAEPGMDKLVLGFYNARVEEIRAVSSSDVVERQRDMPRNVRAMDQRVVLFHEYAHHFVMANNRVTYPSWYQEGFAEFLSTAEFNDKGADIGKFTAARARWLNAGDWLNIETFLTKRPGMLSSDETLQFYAQAWLATHYLFDHPDRARGFDKYIASLNSGGDAMGAFEPAFGVTPQEFDKELRAYKRKPIQFWTMPGVSQDETSLVVQRMGASADDLLMPVCFLRGVPPKARAADAIKKIREQAAKYPGDAFALRAKALAEVWFGDLAEARRQIDGLIAMDAKDAETQHLSGLCFLRTAQARPDVELYKSAQSAFGRAHNLDATRAASMFRYVESGLGATGRIDTHLLDVLVAAYQLAPQVYPIAITTAQALMANDRFEEALVVLRPLTADPHGTGRAEMARDLMAKAAAKKPAQFFFVGSAAVSAD